MKYLNSKFVLIYFAAFISCNAQNNLAEIELRKCVEQKINASIYKTPDANVPIDYFQLMSGIESYFLKKKLFQDEKSKEEYLILVDHIINQDLAGHKLMKEEMDVIFRKQGYNGLYFGYEVLQRCPHLIMQSKRDLPESMLKQFHALDNLCAFDLHNQKFINGTVTSVLDKDFENILYRAPVILILVDFIYRKSEKN